MIAKSKVIDLAKKKALEMDCFLVDVKVSASNDITILFDNNKGVLLQDWLEMRRYIEDNLDRDIEDYALSVCSPGASNPFLVKEQYAKNIGKEVSVKFTNGKRLTGILNSYKESFILLEIKKKVKKQIIKELVEVDKKKIKEIKRKINFK